MWGHPLPARVKKKQTSVRRPPCSLHCKNTLGSVQACHTQRTHKPHARTHARALSSCLGPSPPLSWAGTGGTARGHFTQQSKPHRHTTVRRTRNCLPRPTHATMGDATPAGPTSFGERGVGRMGCVRGATAGVVRASPSSALSPLAAFADGEKERLSRARPSLSSWPVPHPTRRPSSHTPLSLPPRRAPILRWHGHGYL